MNKEEIKEEFLKSYNCSSMKEFKHTKLTNEKFYEIMEDYFTKCSYNQKYKEVIDKAIKYIDEYRDYQDVHKQIGFDQYEDVTEDILFEKNIEELLDILKEVK